MIKVAEALAKIREQFRHLHFNERDNYPAFNLPLENF